MTREQEDKKYQTPFNEQISKYTDNDCRCYLQSIVDARHAIKRTKHPIMETFYNEVCELAQQYINKLNKKLSNEQERQT